MFDIGFGELLVCAIIALLVLGPERLPGAVRTVGRWVGRARHTVNNFTDQIDREIRAEDLKRRIEEEMKKVGVNDIAKQVNDALHAPLPPPLIGADHLRGESSDKPADKSGHSTNTEATPSAENAITTRSIAVPPDTGIASLDAASAPPTQSAGNDDSAQNATIKIATSDELSASTVPTIPAPAGAGKSP